MTRLHATECLGSTTTIRQSRLLRQNQDRNHTLSCSVNRFNITRLNKLRMAVNRSKGEMKKSLWVYEW